MKVRRIHIFFNAFIGLIILISASCATTVNVNLTRPAKLDLNGAQTIAVLPIKPSSYYKEYDIAFGRHVVINTFYQIFDIKDQDEQLAIDTLKSRIEHGLLDSPYIKLVSSDSVERALRKGTLNPADVYLVGEVTFFDVRDYPHEERRLIRAARGDQMAEYEIVRYWVREVDFHFRYQIVDSYTEKVISYNEFRCNETSSKYDSRRSLPGAYHLIESDIRIAARKILQELQPYVVTKSITLLESKTKDKALKERMKNADELADNSNIKEAYEEFNKIYQDSGLVEAGYNAAILQEAMGNLSEAEKMMQEVYAENPDTRVAKGLADIQNEIKLAKRLQQQIKENNSEPELDEIEESEDPDDWDF